LTCSKIDGELKKCHNAAKFCLQRGAKRAGVHVQVDVFGVFTRALRGAAVKRCEEHMKRRPREKQDMRGSCPIC
jgi:hypothetical protein